MIKILVLCTGNSCRSQMAEGILKWLDSGLSVVSAGTEPASEINPRTVQVMREIGIDISGQYPKSVDNFVNEDFDYVITVCDNALESCPVFIGRVKNRLHIGFEDPARATGSEEEILAKYREVRDLIREKFTEFYNSIVKQ